MSLAHRISNVQARGGDAIVGALVTVTTYTAGAAATLYSDAAGTPIVGGAVTTDSNGFYEYYATPGAYSEAVSYAGNALASYSNIQLPPVPAVITDATANHNIAVLEVWDYLRMTNAGANTVTMTSAVLALLNVNDEISGVQAGAGQTTLTAGGGVTFNATPGVKTRAQYSAWTIKKVAAGVCDVFGDLSA